MESAKKQKNNIVKKIKGTTLYKNLGYAYAYKKIQSKQYPKKNKKLNIVFLVARPSVWNSVKTVYEAAKRNEKINTYIVAMPAYKNKQFVLEDNTIYDFCKGIDEEAICSYNRESKEYFPLESLTPDIVVYSLPYQDQYPEVYRFDKVCKYCKLCYISYGYTMKKNKLQSISVRYEVLRDVSYIFSCNQIMYNYYKKYMIVSQLISGKRLYNIGFPRFDLYKLKEMDSTEILKENRTIMWLPRWTTDKNVADNGNEGSSFFEVKDKIIEYMSKNSKEDLIVRPHPLAFENYIQSGAMSNQEVEEYKAKIALSENIVLDTNPSYYENLVKTDILIADFTSILVEFFITGRPIIYFGSGAGYPKEHQEMYESFYHVKTWKEAEKILDDLLKGIDVKREQRTKAVKNFVKGKPQNIGEQIIDIFLENNR